MQFDDRLATVLRHRAQSEPGARTQYRQLLDLLGATTEDKPGEWLDAAYVRLAELANELPPAVQSGILRAPGLRLRNRALVAWLARGDPQAAAAAVATAQLTERDWLYLIPRLPMAARGFLRHRRDLPLGARQVLERLGVGDLVLSDGTRDAKAAPIPARDDAALPTSPAPGETGIGALVRRIEAFQRARRDGTSPPLSHQEPSAPATEPAPRHPAFDFATDATGSIVWADPGVAPLLVGMNLASATPAALAVFDAADMRAMQRRLPLRAARVTLSGIADIAGDWRVDAAPAFTPVGGHFDGYRGRMRRPAHPTAMARPDGPGDRMRQLLHELRTPVNAVQGYAELIQQQLFGPAPNEYRALAAAVAVDAARLMAGFDEIDRMARLEAGAIELDEGNADWRIVVADTLRRLEGALRPRSARIELTVSGPDHQVTLAETDARQLAWRLLATLAGALAPGEIIDLAMIGDGREVTLTVDLPIALLGEDDPFGMTGPTQPRAISAGMFGTGFTLRLARAEADAAGGSLRREGESMRLTLPALTAFSVIHTSEA